MPGVNKCDLTSAFRPKRAPSPPPLHPSPHFHPPCRGRRMTVVRRLSTSARPPSCGRQPASESVELHFSALTWLCPPRTLLFCLLCCMSHASRAAASSPPATARSLTTPSGPQKTSKHLWGVGGSAFVSNAGTPLKHHPASRSEVGVRPPVSESTFEADSED